jgi:Mn2+/Fe2+ NRAMP family transporter
VEDDRNKLLEVIGPGLVLAGSAIGVSHLVQSTRAGAMYGLALLGFILVSMLAKYPAFLFGPRYAAATGRSLLSGYRQQGWYIGTGQSGAWPGSGYFSHCRNL